MRHMPQSCQDGLRNQKEKDDNEEARVDFVRVDPAKTKDHKDRCVSAGRKQGLCRCVAHCEVSPHYDGHHTTVWEDYPPPGVISLDCEYQPDVRDQLGQVNVPHVCPEILKVEEWDTMANDYWGSTMDVAAILDKKC